MPRIFKLYNSFTRCLKPVQVGGNIISAPRNGQLPKLTHGSLYICGPTVYSDSHLGHALTYIRADLFRNFAKSLFNIRLLTVMNITDIDDKILAKTFEQAANSQTAAREDNGNTVDHQRRADVTPSTEHLVNLSHTEPRVTRIPTDPVSHPFNQISDKYYKSFCDDMAFIRVQPVDLTVKVSKQIHLIINYIKRLERDGHAYVASNGDIYFKISSVANYIGRTDPRKNQDISQQQQSVRTASEDSAIQRQEEKGDPKDFALWKAAKPNEPVWLYQSEVTGRVVPGRPGWHVQCSAIASAIFGAELDFHFGGKDLIFPHHYNEEACCCAYHNLDTSQTLHVWSRNWLHSGHLVLRDEKMSKSTGNVVGIRRFISDTSVNALRLLCVSSHYRADIDFDMGLVQKIKSLDHKLSAFSAYLRNALRDVREGNFTLTSSDREACSESLAALNSTATSYNDEVNEDNGTVASAIRQTHEEIVEGVCEDFDLERGLDSILKLSKLMYAQSQVKPLDLMAAWLLLRDWCNMCGLEYGYIRTGGDSADSQRKRQEPLVDLLQEFRQNVRRLALNEMSSHSDQTKANIKSIALAKTLLAECDETRNRMDELGFVIRDGAKKKTKP